MLDNTTVTKRALRLPLALALVGCAVAACADARPERNVEQGGVLESPTHEADSLRRAEEQEEQNR